MKVKEKIKGKLPFLAFALYPTTTLINCTVFSVIVIAILEILMVTAEPNSAWYNIIFALTTGAAASFFVSIIVEMSSNFKHNRLAWHELQEYYRALMNYEGNKQVAMQLTPHQRAENKAYEDYLAAGGREKKSEKDKPKDIIQATWGEIPEIIPVFERTVSEKKELLSEKEIEELEIILSEYETIRFAVRNRIWMSPMTYDAFNNPDEEFLKSVYTANVIKNMPKWIKTDLACKESEKACERYIDAILSDANLLQEFMKNYDVSENGLNKYSDEGEEQESAEDIESHFENNEQEDKEASRRKIEESDQQMEIEERPFWSHQLSQCCRNIAERVEKLEKCVAKKPYYGMLMKAWRNSQYKPIDDVISKMAYESEKSRLEKELSRQKTGMNVKG